jgi:taurine dioxygenase
MGAEITGVRLGETLAPEAFDEIRDALWRHKMVYLRDQHLTHAEHEAFSARFGPFAVDAYTQGVEGHRNVHPLIKEADTKTKALFGSGWHTDSPFLDEPPSVTILRAVEVPPYGGDTTSGRYAAGVADAEPHHAGHAAPAEGAYVGRGERGDAGADQRQADGLCQ